MLILVPTALELAALAPGLSTLRPGERPVTWAVRPSLRAEVAVIGFGLAAAGSRAGVLLAGRTDRACLVGCCGTYRPDELPVGTAVFAASVELDGIGFGRPDGPGFVAAGEGAGPLAEEIRAAPPAVPLPMAAGPGAPSAGMLSVACASEDRDHARERARRHPSCAVEEMEAHAVLHAAAAAGTTLSVLRGISNVAGERDARSWQIREAMQAVREALEIWLAA